MKVKADPRTNNVLCIQYYDEIEGSDEIDLHCTITLKKSPYTSLVSVDVLPEIEDSIPESCWFDHDFPLDARSYAEHFPDDDYESPEYKTFVNAYIDAVEKYLWADETKAARRQYEFTGETVGELYQRLLGQNRTDWMKDVLLCHDLYTPTIAELTEITKAEGSSAPPAGWTFKVKGKVIDE